jgi:hypothetical protein
MDRTWQGGAIVPLGTQAGAEPEENYSYAFRVQQKWENFMAQLRTFPRRGHQSNEEKHWINGVENIGGLTDQQSYEMVDHWAKRRGLYLGTWQEACHACHLTGHKKDECPFRECYKCGERGHIAPVCNVWQPWPFSATDGTPAQNEQGIIGLCYICKQSGHHSKDGKCGWIVKFSDKARDDVEAIACCVELEGSAKDTYEVAYWIAVAEATGMLSSQHVECGIFRRHFKTSEHEGLANLRLLTPKHATVFINKFAQKRAEGSPLSVPDRTIAPDCGPPCQEGHHFQERVV